MKSCDIDMLMFLYLLTVISKIYFLNIMLNFNCYKSFSFKLIYCVHVLLEIILEPLVVDFFE